MLRFDSGVMLGTRFEWINARHCHILGIFLGLSKLTELHIEQQAGCQIFITAGCSQSCYTFFFGKT